MAKYPKYLGKSYNTYFVELTVPKDVRAVLGTRRFHKSLQTDSLSQAESRKWSYIEKWKKLIKAARATSDTTEAKGDLIALWREKVGLFLQGEPDSDLVAWDAVTDIAQGSARGTDHPAVLGYKEYTGQIVRLENYFEDWCRTLKPSTLKTYKNAVREFIKVFPFAHDISETAVTEYFRGLDVSYSSKKVYSTGVRQFAGYIDYEFGTDLKALIKPDLSREQKTFKKLDRQPWEDSEIQELLKNSQDDLSPYRDLHDLIRLAMYTGCRISELLKLTRQDVKEDYFIIRDSKTDAGRREVPIHPELQQLVARLRITGGETLLPKASYRIKFSNLKKSLGFGPEKVFHSFRNTVSKKLLEEGVSEVVAASILGHKINTMSYGTYAKGAVPLKQKVEAIRLISYES